jgi:hypothetical protein
VCSHENASSGGRPGNQTSPTCCAHVSVSSSGGVFLYRMSIRDRPCSAPLVRGLFTMCSDLLCVAQNFDTSGVVFDTIDRSVELRCPAVGGEHICP